MIVMLIVQMGNYNIIVENTQKASGTKHSQLKITLIQEAKAFNTQKCFD